MREFGLMLSNRVNLKYLTGRAGTREPLFQSFFKMPEKCEKFAYVYK